MQSQMPTYAISLLRLIVYSITLFSVSVKCLSSSSLTDLTSILEFIDIENLSTAQLESLKPKVGSFFSNMDVYNITLGDNYTVEMAMVVGVPGLTHPVDLNDGELLYKNGSFAIRSKGQLSYVDYFGLTWNTTVDELTPNAILTAQQAAENITKLYVNQTKLLTLESTLEMGFISTERITNTLYTSDLISNIYQKLNSESPLKTIVNPQKFFTFADFDNSTWNEEGYWPSQGVLSDTYTYSNFGFDIPYVCKKFKNWVNYSSNETSLSEYYFTNYKDVIANFINFYQETPSFMAPGNFTMDLSASSFSSNLSLAYTLLNNFYADTLNFNWSQPLPKLVPKEGPQKIEDMHLFLTYENFLYSDIHVYMIVKPFFDVMFNEFNTKMQYLNNEANVNITSFQTKLKVIWFTAYQHTLPAIYKMMHYDYRIKSNNGFISQPTTWPSSVSKNYLYFPSGAYGETVHFELLSEWKSLSTDTKPKRLFYIAMRANFSSGYIFVLPIRSFNMLAKLFMIEPSFSLTEKSFFCQYQANTVG